MVNVIKKVPVPEVPLDRLLLPFTRFRQIQAGSGILLLACVAAALVWVNSPWGHTYAELWETELSFGFGKYALAKSLLHWINDGLMAVFFFVVGLEIKREMLAGELASPRRAAFPVIAALGGMLVPALLYIALNGSSGAAHGWGIPMATDIAFALGVLSLVRSPATAMLTLFLTALAIADDLGAVVVVAAFYTSDISWVSLAVGGGFLAVMVVANRSGVRHPVAYALLGIGLWVAFLESGIHPTIAGVLAAMTIPASRRIDTKEFLKRAEGHLKKFERAEGHKAAAKQVEAIQALQSTTQEATSPLHRLEDQMHPWVAYAIMPVFALANAGVVLTGNFGDTITNSAAVGVIVGLVVGKPLGIVVFSWLAVRLGLARMPSGTTWWGVIGIGCIGGIGFTMSLFITGLAFDDAALTQAAKVGILVASVASATIGLVVLRMVGRSAARKVS
ncbi:MAG: Na+/H+ antiporter NhaA [SAR202 cluster bacterium]|nr:Na+/H+ antiporter NhaA [SAR202 cluster bacterium]